MAYSYATTVATGLTDLVAVPFPYLDRTHVHVSVDSVDVDDSLLVWTGPSQIELPSTPANGSAVRVYRSTPVANPLVVFSPGAQDAAAFNLSNLQFLYICQETLDQAESAFDVSEQVLAYLDQMAFYYNQTSVAAAAALAAKNAAEAALAAMAGGLADNSVSTIKIQDNAVTTNKIADNAITLQKLANTTATQRLLGRNSPGTGIPENITLTQALDWLGSSNGMVLARGASGWSARSAGTFGNSLRSAGGANPPDFASAPAVQARKGGTDQTGIAAATYTKITFTTEDVDTAGIYQNGNSRFIPLADTRIKIKGHLLVTGSGVSDQTNAQVAVYANGTIDQVLNIVRTSGTSFFGIPFSTRALPGDGSTFYEIFLYITATGPFTVDGTSSSTWISAYFC